MTEFLQAEVARLEGLVYVPGLWKCAKCSFQLFQSSLNANTGAVSIRDDPGDKCPNCTTPLWRVTERQAGNDLVDRWRNELERTNTAESEFAKAREVIRPFAEAADDLDDKHANHSPIWESPAAMNIRAADLRAARAFQGEK